MPPKTGPEFSNEIRQDRSFAAEQTASKRTFQKPERGRKWRFRAAGPASVYGEDPNKRHAARNLFRSEASGRRSAPHAAWVLQMGSDVAERSASGVVHRAPPVDLHVASGD